MNITNLKLNWMFWHRWLGLATCVGILLWGVSGISHPIMTRSQPKPAAFVAPSAKFDLSNGLSLKTVLIQHNIKQFQHISLAQFLDESYFRVGFQANQPARYFNTKTGQELQNGDLEFAKILASHFTGNEISKVTDAKLINNFSDDYHAVNRLLPVWRVEFSSDNHLRAYTDTEQVRLATLVDDRRYWLTKLFQFGHNLSFLETTPKIQLGVAATVLIIILISSTSGLYLFFTFTNSKQRLAKKVTRKWHRRIGLSVSVATLIFASSGLFHLIMSYQQQAHALVIAPEHTNTNHLNEEVWKEISVKSLAKLDLFSLSGIPYWYILVASSDDKNQMPVAQVAALANEREHGEHHKKNEIDKAIAPIVIRADESNQTSSSQNSTSQHGAEMLAKQQVALISGRPMRDIVRTEWITKFAKEYGFIFKRIPVIKVQMNDADQTRYYIEPATGVISAKVRNIDGFEGIIFAYLHKWSFENINKDLRDILVSLFALGNIVVAFLGFYLFTRRYI
jgi:uncharacterized iron-regulated membrane protein